MPRLRPLALILVLGAAAGVAACSRTAPPAVVSPAPMPADTESVLTLPLRRGDVLKVTVFGHDDLNGEYPIDENWKLILPMIGEMDVRDMTVPQVRQHIREQFGRLYTQSFIAVVPLFRVAVLGEVNRPSLYSVDPTMTIYDVLALAGGVTRSGRETQMRLIRGGQQVPAPVDAQALARATLRELGVHSGDQIIVPRKSMTYEFWVVVLQVVNTALLAYTIFRK
jgi:polysaccharide export outer membrane protein